MENIKRFAKKLIKAFMFKWKLIIVISVLIGLSLFAVFDFEVDSSAVTGAGEIVRGELAESVSINGKSWAIDETIYEKIRTKFREKGITFDNLKDEDLIKIVKAELVTNYPNLGDEVDINDKTKFQGIVNFIRRDAEGTNDGVLMQYMPEEEFNNYVESGDYGSIKNMFTIDFGTNSTDENTESNDAENSTAVSSVDDAKKNDMQIVVATMSDFDGEVTISTQKINYKPQVSNYSVPIEFIIANLQITNSEEYATAIADMVVDNSKIDYLIQDCYNETIIVGKHEYYKQHKEYSESEDAYVNTTKEGPIKETTGTTTMKTWTIVSYIREADIWAANVTNEYKKVEDGPTTTRENEVVGLEDIVKSSELVYVNRKTYDEVTIKNITYTKIMTGSIGEGTAVDGDGYDYEYTVNGRNFREYKQNKGSYKDELYSEGKMSNSGCGPTAVAIVASGYVEGYSPLDVAKQMGGAHNGGTNR